ncbi:hypothetical protein [Aestuariivita sp.]|uniref:hypothetical protein n=1 Tax=Aestuariivita sp. TaxID=1872407 RepID=UPI00216E034B|nr:hypothetical protein [Aestuariivita sp.]MCE8005955.1 hypothetical protein [Aestuariivita sp.]
MLRLVMSVLLVLWGATLAMAETSRTASGGDRFVAGDAVIESFTAPRDAFLAASSAVARGTVAGDLHVSGYDVAVSSDVGADLYAAGSSVTIQSRVGEDLSAAGMTVRVDPEASVTGNARLMGRTVTIEGPITGALIAVGRTVVLNAPISGDAQIVARTITFGPEAVVTGTLSYATRAEIAVPERVAPADRVRFEAFSISDALDSAREDWKLDEMPMLPAFLSAFSALVISLFFFVALGALMLGFFPRVVEGMRTDIVRRPGQMIVLGVVGLSMLFGMTPIIGMTLVGLPFIPAVLLAIVVVWTFGYALGAYTVGLRLWTAFGGEADPGMAIRLLVLAGAVVAIALLNFIPFVGWVVNYTLVLLGIGAMVNVLFHWMIGNPGQALDADMKPINDRSK